MQHGFKTKAERIAVEMRELVGVPTHSPLPARKLAKKLKIPVLEPNEIPGLPPEITRQLLFEFVKNWSGVTIPVDGESIIIYNPNHIPARQESDIMHELAHILCKHKPARIEMTPFLPWKCRTFDKEQEDQASWLGGCLQIPRCALIVALRERLDNAAIADRFGASPEMVRFRRNMSGVDKILRRELRDIVAPILEKEIIGNGNLVPIVSPSKPGSLVQADLFA